MRLIKVPCVRQGRNYTCGVACVQSIFGYNGIDLREDVHAKELSSNEDEGTNIFRIAEYLNNNDIPAQFRHDMTLDELKQCLMESKPIICPIQAWRESDSENYEDDWADGHYVIAIGFDDNSIFFMDPSTLGNYTYIPWEEFLARWHDMDSENEYRRCGIVVTSLCPVYNPDVFLRLG